MAYKVYKDIQKTKASGKVLSDEALEISNNQHWIASKVYKVSWLKNLEILFTTEQEYAMQFLTQCNTKESTNSKVTA